MTLADQKNEKVAKADNNTQSQTEKGAQLGIQIAPAEDVAGAGDKVSPSLASIRLGMAAEQGLAAGNVILGHASSGKPVSTPQDVKSGIESAKSQGKKAVMMRI